MLNAKGRDIGKNATGGGSMDTTDKELTCIIS
jgi:hypothetical protein